MNGSRVLATGIVLALIFLTLLVYSPGLAATKGQTPGSLSPWGSAASYPITVHDISCAASSGYVYCVGGYTTSTYYAQLVPTGISGTQTTSTSFTNTISYQTWIANGSYPIAVGQTSCVTYSGYMYCIGGRDQTGKLTNVVYFTQVSASGMGGWQNATGYPVPIAAETCVAGAGYIYCVGGLSGSTINAPNGGVSNTTYYAPIKSNGALGQWQQTTGFPMAVAFESCVAYSGYAYCIGGSNQGSNQVFFAPMTSSGLGNWIATSSYPTIIYRPSCTTNLGYIYCVGGQRTSGAITNATYYAPLTAPGIGNWTSTTPYPTPIRGQSCVTDSTYVYCVGGGTAPGVYTGATDYSQINIPITNTVTSVSTSVLTSTTTSTATVTVSRTETRTSISNQTITTFLTSTETLTRTSTLATIVTQPPSTVTVTAAVAPNIVVETRNSSGARLQGVVVSITGPNGFSASVPTNSSGYALFRDLMEGGTYFLVTKIQNITSNTSVVAHGSVTVIFQPTYAPVTLQSTSSTTPERNTIPVQWFIAGLVGVVIAIPVVLVWHKRRREGAGEGKELAGETLIAYCPHCGEGLPKSVSEGWVNCPNCGHVRIEFYKSEM